MRCGHESVQEYRLLGWPKIKPTPGAFIFWHIVNFPGGNVNKKAAVEAFTKVFDVWQKAMDKVEPPGRVIQYESTPNFDQAHIKLVFVHPGLLTESFLCADGQFRTFDIPSKLDGPGGVLAYVPRGNQTIFFDQGENWVAMGIDSQGEISLFDVALHEVGHTLDLAHSMVKNAVMGTYYTGESKGISEDDEAALNQAWSKTKTKIHESKF